MRFSFLCHEFPPIGGGAASALDSLTRTLAKRNYAVQIITIGYTSTKQQVRMDEFGREIVLLPARRRTLLAPGKVELLLSVTSLAWYSHSHVQRFAPTSPVAYFAFPAGLVGSFLRWKTKIPLVVSLRGSDVPGFSNARWGKSHRIQRLLIWPAFRFADRIIANGEFLTSLANQPFSDLPSPVVNVPNGIDLDSYTPNRSSTPHVPLKLLVVGQLIPRKRCDLLLQAIASTDDLPQVVAITFVGDGPQRTTLEQYATSELGQTPVNFLGAVSRERMPTVYAEHDVLVHLSSSEGVSNVIMEAIASGLALIATKDAVDGEIKRQMPDLLTAPTLKDIQDRLYTFLKSPDSIRLAGKRNRTIAEQRSWEVQTDVFLKTVRTCPIVTEGNAVDSVGNG